MELKEKILLFLLEQELKRGDSDHTDWSAQKIKELAEEHKNGRIK